MRRDYECHPLCLAFPEMPDKEFQELKADIRANGVLEWGTLWEGKILDGRHRYRACVELGLEMTLTEPDLSEEPNFDPAKYVIAKNMARRHLTKAQRAKAADAVRDYYEGRAVERKETKQGRPKKAGDKPVAKLPPVSGDGKARDEAGAAFGVSGKMVDYARDVRELGCDELRAMVDRDEIALAKAAEIARHVKSATEQVRLAKEHIATKGKSRKAKPAKSKPAEATNETQQIRQWLKVFDGFTNKLTAIKELMLHADAEMVAQAAFLIRDGDAAA